MNTLRPPQKKISRRGFLGIVSGAFSSLMFFKAKLVRAAGFYNLGAFWKAPARKLYTWGYGSIGHLGQGNSIDLSRPTQVGSNWDWKAVSTSSDHTLAIRTDGSLWAWGYNIKGYLGLGNIIYKSSPTQVGTLTSWSYIAATSTDMSFAIQTNGTLWAWGNYTTPSTSTGLGDSLIRSSPTQVGTLTDWSRVYSKEHNTFAIKTDGSLWGWGYNYGGSLGLGLSANTVGKSSPNQVGLLTDWLSVATAGFCLNNINTFAVKTGGSLWAWGDGGLGRIGNGSAIDKSSPNQVGTLTDWKKVAAGGFHVAAVKTDGTLWVWGYNCWGQLGNGTSGYLPTPRSFDTQTWIVANHSGTAGLCIRSEGSTTNGSLWAWGYGLSGSLGLINSNNYSSPTQVGTLTSWVKISSGANSSTAFTTTHAIQTNGTLWAWGGNTTGALGLNDVKAHSSPTQVGTLTCWANVFTGPFVGMATQTNGTLWAWGDNSTYGSAGVSSPNDISSPTQVGTLTDWAFLVPSSQSRYGFYGTKTNGTLWCWGTGFTGRMGLGNTNDYSSPVQVGTLTDWSPGIYKIAAGDRHGLAVKTDGSLWSWGYNAYGALGIGNTTVKSSPVQVGVSTDWSKVFGVLTMSYAIKTNGTLWGWGVGGAGSPPVLGTGGPYQHYSSPVQIGTFTNWMQISGQDYYGTFALRSDGSMYQWGYNNSTTGSMALGGTGYEIVSSPIQLGTVTNWVNVECGHMYTAAIKNDGSLWMWGYAADQFQFGDNGVTFQTSSPIQVGTGISWSVSSTEQVLSCSDVSVAAISKT